MLLRFSFFVTTIIVVCLLIPASCQTQQQTQRNTQWFEDTIDDFLRAAQENGESTDLQISTCKISSQQLVATAQATAARVLKGVCNPSENEVRFRKLEVQLGDQLNALRVMVVGMEEKMESQEATLKAQHERLLLAVSSTCSSRANDQRNCVPNDSSSRRDQTEAPPVPSYSPRYIPLVPHQAQEVTHESEEDQSVENSSSSSAVGARMAEIHKYNSTVHIENGKRVFSYYWIVSGMAYKLSSWSQRRALRSNSFYIYPRGYSLYLKIIPKYLSNTMYIHVGITKGIYDDSLEWPFTSKLRLSVLMQDEARSVQDLKSRVWNPRDLCSGTNWRKPVYTDNPECVGLGFPHNVINSPDYISNDQIVIKLSVQLD